MSFSWTQWAGNGHYYQIIAIDGSDYSWTTARAQAEALVGPGGTNAYLATLTSAEENAFVFGLADNPAYWLIDTAGNNEGPYIGALQTPGSGEPGGGWTWVTGEAWGFTNWAPGEPNNFGGAENWGTLFGPGGVRSGLWNDVGNSPDSIIKWYVAEADPVPEPATLAALGLGAISMLRRRRKA